MKLTALHRFWIALVLMFAAGVLPARAQDDSAARLAAARSVIEASRATEGMLNMLPGLAQQVARKLVSATPTTQRDIEAAFAPALEKMKVRQNDLITEIAQLYADVFSLAELKDIEVFYRSTTGQKVVKVMPDVGQVAAAIAQKWSFSVANEMEAMVRDELTKKGHKIP